MHIKRLVLSSTFQFMTCRDIMCGYAAILLCGFRIMLCFCTINATRNVSVQGIAQHRNLSPLLHCLFKRVLPGQDLTPGVLPLPLEAGILRVEVQIQASRDSYSGYEKKF